jgi:hypothetical protein
MANTRQEREVLIKPKLIHFAYNHIKVDSLFKKLEKYSDRISKSEQLSREFLIKAGIVTPKGNLKKNFKHICMPPAQV